MNLIMHDFSYRYKSNAIDDLLYYNKERQKLADKTIHYNDLRIKQSKVFYKLSKNNTAIEKLQKSIDDLACEIWEKSC